MKNIFLFVLGISTNYFLNAAPNVTLSGGNWTTNAIWSLGYAPVAGDIVIISAGHSVSVTTNTNVIADLTVNGEIIVSNSATSSLSMNGNLIINAGGRLENNGNFDIVDGGTWAMNGNATYVHNPRANVLSDESPFYNTFETFSATSWLYIEKWNDNSIPLCDPTRVNGNVGNVSMKDSNPRWDQDGYFAPNKIKGKLIVWNTQIVMDDGTAGTTALTLQDVEVYGTGSIMFQSGGNRNLTLITNNFTQNTVAGAYPVTVSDSCFGIIQWTVNGNMTLNNDFIGLKGSPQFAGAGQMRLIVNGNIDINGGKFELVKAADAPLTFTVSGNTTIGAATTKVRFVDGYNGASTFTTQNFNVLGCNDIVLMGMGSDTTPKARGANTVTVLNDFSITGASSTWITKTDTNIAKTIVAVGRDLIINASNSSLYGALSNGDLSFRITRNFTISAGSFHGKTYCIDSLKIDSIITNGDFTFSSAGANDYFRGSSGIGKCVIRTIGNFNLVNSSTTLGNGYVGYFRNGTSSNALTFYVGGNLVQSAGRFTGTYRSMNPANMTIVGQLRQNAGFFNTMYNDSVALTATITFTAGSIDFRGGKFLGFYAANNTSANATHTITGNLDIIYSAATDTFSLSSEDLIGAESNKAILVLNVGGNMSISGANGTFISSRGSGIETITITGNISFASGNNSFNLFPSYSGANGHNVTLTCNNFTVSGGNNYIAASRGIDFFVTVNGDMSVTGGTISIMGDGGSANFSINGSYSQNAGTFYFHNNTVTAGSGVVNFNVNNNGDAIGDFTLLGGTINTDNNPNTLFTHKMYLKCPVITYGGGGVMTRAGAGTGTTFTDLTYNRAGTSNMNVTGAYTIQQIKQYINTGTTVDLVTGSLQVCSHAAVSYYLTLQIASTLNVRGNQVYSNAIAANSGVLINNDARFILSNPFGFYDGTTNAALSSAGNMIFLMTPTSIIEYNGVANQIITGIGVGNATSSSQKYGILAINMQGAPGSVWAYPTALPSIDKVFVRTRIDLMAGELNLDLDHFTGNGGGRTIILESALTTAINRTAGYIRCETEDGSGIFRWKMGSTLGNHVIPFGKDGTAAGYIPFTYAMNSGTADTVSVSTYGTNAANNPLPPTVTHVRNNTGSDNSVNTVDRFWYLRVSGSSVSHTVTFIPTASEAIANPRAQRWIASLYSWELPYQGTQSNSGNGTLASGLTNVGNTVPGSNTGNWWTLSNISSPLPVDFISIIATCEGKSVDVKWSTASEINNDYFEVQRSSNGFDWQAIGTVAGAGNSSTTLHYSLTDNAPLNSKSYYRVMQYDFDGQSKSSAPVAVRNCNSSEFDFNVYHHNNIATMGIYNPLAGNYTIEVVSAEGKVVYNEKAFLPQDYSEFNISTDLMSEGIYLIRLKDETSAVVKKFVINR